MKRSQITVSLIIPYYHSMFSTFYTLEIIKEVSQAAVKLKVDVLIETTEIIPDVSGILFADLIGNEVLIKKAERKKLPYIILNYFDKGSSHNCIGIDNEKASYDVLNYLIKAGHSRIATVTGKLNIQTGIQRLEGYKRALEKNNIPVDKRYIVNGDWTRKSGRIAMKKLLKMKALPTAVFFAGDEMAIGAIEFLKEEGINIPRDISLVGFDNIPQAGVPGISLDSVEQPFHDMAELGVKELLRIIINKSKKQVKINLDSTSLIKRASVRKL